MPCLSRLPLPVGLIPLDSLWCEMPPARASLLKAVGKWHKLRELILRAG